MKIRSLRIASQTFFFLLTWAGLVIGMTGLIYPYFFCVASPGAFAACPIKIVENVAIGSRNSALIFAYMLGFLGLVTLLFGRAFCGWACPIGFTVEVLYKLRSIPVRILKAAEPHLEGGKKFAAGFPIKPKHYKYIILVLIPILSLLTGKLIFTDIDPIGALTATIPQLLMGGYEPAKWFATKMFLLLFFLLMSFVVMRSWCRFLCPLGAAFAPMNKFSFLHLENDESRCIHCNECKYACPMMIDLPEQTRDMECILCGRCVGKCPTSALSLKFINRKIF